MTPGQRRLLTEACTKGLHRSPTGQARNPPYGRIALNGLIARGYIDHDWRVTAAGRAAFERTTT